MALTVVPMVPVSEAWRSLPELYSLTADLFNFGQKLGGLQPLSF